MPTLVKTDQRIIVGRTERVDFPKLKLHGIAAKIDTGAYTCALHCHDIIVRSIAGKNYLCFKLLDPSHPEYNEREIRFRQFSEKNIKNSFGELERRFVIKTAIRIAGKRIMSTISLTHRGSMKYPVLIGRRLLKNKFVVDVSIKGT
jgi:hypothetical protein